MTVAAYKKAAGEEVGGGERKGLSLATDFTTFALPVKSAAGSASASMVASCLSDWGAFVAAGVKYAEQLEDAAQFLALFANAYRAQLEPDEQPAVDHERIRTFARCLFRIQEAFSVFVASVHPEDVPVIEGDWEVSR